MMKKIIILLVMVATFVCCKKAQNANEQSAQQTGAEMTDTLDCCPPMVVLRPLNNFPRCLAERVKKQLQAYNHEMFIDVEISPNEKLSLTMMNTAGTRYRADSIINSFRKSAGPKSGIIGLISEDISVPYKGKSDWGVLGFSWKGRYVSVASTYRLKNPQRDFWKVVVHEYIHAHFNYGHCPKDNPTCIMKDAKGHADFSNKRDLCAYCKEHIYDDRAY